MKKFRKILTFPYLAWFLKIPAIGSRSDEFHFLFNKWFSLVNLFRKCSEVFNGSKKNISNFEFHFTIFEFCVVKSICGFCFWVGFLGGAKIDQAIMTVVLSLNDFMYTENFQIENLVSQIYTVTISSPLFCLLLLSTLPSQLIERFVEMIRIKVLHGFVSCLATLFTLLFENVLSLDISSLNSYQTASTNRVEDWKKDHKNIWLIFLRLFSMLFSILKVIKIFPIVIGSIVNFHNVWCVWFTTWLIFKFKWQ